MKCACTHTHTNTHTINTYEKKVVIPQKLVICYINAQDFYRSPYEQSYIITKSLIICFPLVLLHCLLDRFCAIQYVLQPRKGTQMHKIAENNKTHVILNRCYSHIPSNKDLELSQIMRRKACVYRGFAPVRILYSSSMASQKRLTFQDWQRKHNVTFCVRLLLCMAAFGCCWE